METERPIYAGPQEYRDRRESQLREWGSLIEDLKTKADQVETRHAVEKYYERIEGLHATQEKARRQLQELEGADQETWEKLKTRTDKVLMDLKKAMERLASDIS
jgi:hypothetical protein